MSQLARIFLQVQAGDTDPFGLTVHFDIDPAVQTDRLVILRDLIRFGRIGVKIVLAVELADIADGAVQRHGCFHRVFHRLAVQHRQHAGMTKTDGTGVRIGRSAKFCGAAAKILDLV